MSRMIPTRTQIHCGAPMVGLLPGKGSWANLLEGP